MQASKFYIVLIIILLSIYKVYGQPSPKRFYFYGNISIYDNKRKIFFTTNDSINFISTDSKIKLSVYTEEVENLSNKTALKFEYRVKSCFKIRSIKSEYWNERKIGEFKTLFEIKKEGKSMLVYFDFTKYNNDLKSDTLLKKINLSFQEGIYKIIDPENPKLIAIKEEK